MIPKPLACLLAACAIALAMLVTFAALDVATSPGRTMGNRDLAYECTAAALRVYLEPATPVDAVPYEVVCRLVP